MPILGVFYGVYAYPAWLCSYLIDSIRPFTALPAGNRPAATLLSATGPAEGDRNPYCPFSPWEKAGMRASGGRAPTGFSFKEHQTRLLPVFKEFNSNSQSPHPSLLPEGEGGIPKAPSAFLPLASCRLPLAFCLLPPPVLAGPVLHGKNGIRAARCLSEASLRGPPFFPGSAGCPKRSAGTQTAGRLFFAYFLLAKQKKVSRRRAIPGQQASAKPRTEASK